MQRRRSPPSDLPPDARSRVTSTRSGGPVAQAKPEIRRGDIIVVNTASVWAYALYSEETLRLEEDDHQPNGFLPDIDDRRTILLRPARDRRLQVNADLCW